METYERDIIEIQKIFPQILNLFVGLEKCGFRGVWAVLSDRYGFLYY